MQVGGIATSLTGVLARFALNIGDVMIVAGLVLYGLYAALLQVRPAMHPLSFLAATIAASAVFMIAPVAVEVATGHVAVIDARTLAAFAYVGIFPSLAANFCFNRGVELIGANRAAPFIHLMPVFGSILAILFLGERPHLFHVAGYALVLIGVALAARR